MVGWGEERRRRERGAGAAEVIPLRPRLTRWRTGDSGGWLAAKRGVLPGEGTPEARHSKVTEAFSSTALLTGLGSMLGGTEGDKQHPSLVGMGSSSSNASHPKCPSPAFPTGPGQQEPHMSSDQGTPLLSQVQDKRPRVAISISNVQRGVHPGEQLTPNTAGRRNLRRPRTVTGTRKDVKGPPRTNKTSKGKCDCRPGCPLTALQKITKRGHRANDFLLLKCTTVI